MQIGVFFLQGNDLPCVSKLNQRKGTPNIWHPQQQAEGNPFNFSGKKTSNSAILHQALHVRPTGVYLLDFFCSGIQFYLLLSPYLCFISLLYLDLYVLGDDALIS